MEVSLLVLAHVAVVDRIDLNQGGIPGQLILGLALVAYLLGLLAIGLFASPKIETEEDFLVAGRRLGLFLCWGSLIATWFEAASMTGSAQNARDEGLIGTILDPFACSLTLIIAGVFYAPALWRMKLLTTGDFFRKVYGPQAELTCCALQIPCYFGWIAGQYIALAAIQQAYFGIPEHWGILIAFVIPLIFTLTGGMWSVSLIDTVQIVIAFVGLIVLGVVSFMALGDGSLSAGWARFVTEYSGPQSHVLAMVPGRDATLGVVCSWFGVWATGLLGNLPGQDLQQRIFSAKSAETARNTCVLAGVFYLVFGLIPVAVGLISRLELPVDSTYVKVNVLIYMAGKNLNVPLAIVFVISFVSIVLSTACSGILAPATILGHNLLGRIPRLQTNKLLLERFCVVIISLAGLSMAFWGKSVLALLDLSLSLQLSALFVPLTMGLYGKPRGQLPAILAAILGCLFFVARYVPEEVLFTLPEELSARGTTYHHFEWLRPELIALQTTLDSMPDSELKQELQLKIQSRTTELMKASEDAAKSDMQTILVNYLPRDEVAQRAAESFAEGFKWIDYMKLRLSSNRIGPTLHHVLFDFVTIPQWMTLGFAPGPEDRAIGLLTISEDLYGLGASFAGYFLGQWILRRRHA